ncbi:MAG: nucleotidyltransferase domain-containing protein [Synechococcus sp.]|nr:nucleotidyltransferase domain-containing protein [Synechococcus sp.]
MSAWSHQQHDQSTSDLPQWPLTSACSSRQQGCLFGSRARGQARPDSDIDLLITAPDAWLAQRDRFALLTELWGAVAQPDLSVVLVLHSSSEASIRAQEPSSVVHEAFSHGVLLDGKP